MPAHVILTYDVPNWANHAAVRALAVNLGRCAPGEFHVELASSSRLTRNRYMAADLLFSSAFYDWPKAEHPRGITQISGGNYLIRREKPEEFGDVQRTLKLWAHVVAKNRALMDSLGPDDHPRIRLMYHPWDHVLFTPDGPALDRVASRFRIGFAGHESDASKGVGYVREAVKLLGEDRVEFVHLGYTPGPAGDLPHDEMPKWYRSLDAYVCMASPDVTRGGPPGQQEGAPRPAVEAWLCGVPVVGSPGGQVGEMMIDEVNALVIERDAHALADAIERLIGDRRTRERLARNARPSILDGWVLGVGEAWADYLREVLES